MRFIFHPLAFEEAIQAPIGTDKKAAKTALDFVLKVQQSIELILKYPSIGTKTIRQARRISLKTFPFGSCIRLKAIF